jgi:hypothetical protein
VEAASRGLGGVVAKTASPIAKARATIAPIHTRISDPFQVVRAKLSKPVRNVKSL